MLLKKERKERGKKEGMAGSRGEEREGGNEGEGDKGRSLSLKFL